MLFEYDENNEHEITFMDYIRVRNCIIRRRDAIWDVAEEHGFSDEYYNEDEIEAFDFVIDTLTELAMKAAVEQDKN